MSRCPATPHGNSLQPHRHKMAQLAPPSRAVKNFHPENKRGFWLIQIFVLFHRVPQLLEEISKYFGPYLLILSKVLQPRRKLCIGLSTSMGALGPRNASAPQDVLGPQRHLGCTGREKPLPRCFTAGLNPLRPNPFPNYPRVCLHGMGQDGVKWAGTGSPGTGVSAGDQTAAARSRLSQPSPTFGGLVPTPHPHPGLAVPGTAQGGEARARQGVGAAPEKGLPKNAIALHKTCSSPAPLPRRWLRSFSPRLNR